MIVAPKTWLITATLAVCVAAPALAEKPNVAVFNFQMKSETAEWNWLEKGLADQITTDFTRSRRITVVARDDMQIVAGKLRWQAQIDGLDQQKLEEIQEQLKTKYIVTGVADVSADRIEIHGQIIDVDRRVEIHRETVSGPLSDVLKLQKKLSAKLLEYFTGTSAELILPQLPVWTESIPAARAVYEGMHLYDQGRYGEAWLKFRQGLNSDGGYLEASYWVGRMYYFMDRYEHARLEYEHFLTADHQHPRLGDAIKEYLHTFEKLGTPTDELLVLYDRMIDLHPEALIYNELAVGIPVSTECWLSVRKALLLKRRGDYHQATMLASGAMEEIQDRRGRNGSEGWAFKVASESAQMHNAMTGDVLLPDGLVEHYHWRDGTNSVIFAPDQDEATYYWDQPLVCRRFRKKDGRVFYGQAVRGVFLAAPDGYVFKSLTVYPITDNRPGEAGFNVWPYDYFSGHRTGKKVKKAAHEGIHLTDLRPFGSFMLRMSLDLPPITVPA